jgi:hypothetical protein
MSREEKPAYSNPNLFAKEEKKEVIQPQSSKVEKLEPLLS